MDEPISLKKPPSILLVDDTPANLQLLSEMLKGRGYRARAAVSGRLALQAIRSDPPDLILLDISMPGMDGYEVCAELKADEKLKDIPVIFLSAHIETMDKIKAFSAGGVDYITKPFQFKEVEARVATHLELRRQKAQLQENYDKLRGLEKLRDGLVHMIIHDLRSPLAGIYGFLELIREKARNTLSPDLLRFISDALGSAKQMARIIGDVLDTSKLEEGKLKLELTDCDLGGIMKEAISGLTPLLAGRELLFTPPEALLKVPADRELISRVIQNLVANAIKFTPKDGGVIRLDIAASGGLVRVSVQDNGPGIAAEYRQKIFEKFAQVELPAGRQQNSTGLGLTFCKLAVEAHGGHIGVDGEEGKGSTFWFELPANAPVSQPPAPPGTAHGR